MKKRIGLVFISLALLSSISAVTVRKTGFSRETPTPEKTETYILREYGGEICVFKDAEKKPAAYTGISTETLTREDKKQLQKGISAETYGELLGLLEDFGS